MLVISLFVNQFGRALSRSKAIIETPRVPDDIRTSENSIENTCSTFWYINLHI